MILQSGGGILQLEISEIEYREALALNTISEDILLDEGYRHMACNCCATVRTSDGKFVIVKLSGLSMNHNKVDNVGGILEKPLSLDTGEDLFNHMLSELEEEVGVGREYVEDIKLISVMLSQRGYVTMYFDVQLSVSSDEVRDIYDGQKEKDPDIQDVIILNKEEYLEYLNGSGRAVRREVIKYLTY